MDSPPSPQPHPSDPSDTPANRFFLRLLVILILGSCILGGLMVVGVLFLVVYSFFDGGALALAVLRFLKWPLIVMGVLMVVGLAQPYVIAFTARRGGSTKG